MAEEALWLSFTGNAQQEPAHTLFTNLPIKTRACYQVQNREKEINSSRKSKKDVFGFLKYNKVFNLRRPDCIVA
jgi:hypothetical protein